MRYISVQYSPFFKKNLWRELAAEANQKAQQMASVIRKIPSLCLSYPVETNQIFFTAPPAWLPLIQEEIFCHLWDRGKNEIRLIVSWNTSDDDVAGVQVILEKISRLS